MIPILDELQDKDGLSVYRVHDGVVQALAKDNTDENGEYFTISADGVTFANANSESTTSLCQQRMLH
ncbi:MAG: hypothetical protein VB018_05090 [Lachnospiraceae bacterium]|nr:hypothetical protein [Lachnospiraceae bacterium]